MSDETTTTVPEAQAPIAEGETKPNEAALVEEVKELDERADQLSEQLSVLSNAFAFELEQAQMARLENVVLGKLLLASILPGMTIVAFVIDLCVRLIIRMYIPCP